MWEAGAVPDAAWKPTGVPLAQRVVLPDSQARQVTIVRPLHAQLAEAEARAAVDAYLKQMGAQLWIQHDFAANARLRKAPIYYD